MDISASICLALDSLKENPQSVDIRFLFVKNKQIVLTSLLTINSILSISLPKTRKSIPINLSEEFIPQYCDINNYKTLFTLKESLNDKNILVGRNITNPFEHIGKSIFINRLAVKLANIDTVCNVTGKIFTFDNKISSDNFTFCDVADGPGGFAEYIQYRFLNNKGYGITLKNKITDWNNIFLNMKQFTTFYGPDNTGNLYTNWKYFIDFVLKDKPEGVDLTICNGKFTTEDTNILTHQEFLSVRLLLTQALIGIGCTKVNGNFIVKIFNIVTKISAQIVCILSQCFHNITIFKPVSSYPDNSEKYLICIGREREIQSYYQLLVKAIESYSDNTYLSTKFEETLPLNFEQWLTQNNSIHINLQLEAMQNIHMYLEGNIPLIKKYNINKFLTIWNLPDTPK